MGVLDDAIREHIELKRQHGASEQDLARQEQEALGPARRETAAVQPAPEPEPEPESDVAPTDVLPAVEELEPEAPVEEFVDSPEAEAVEVLEEPEPAASIEEEDVLEETPEFLQETPEHDRLWFEQKPPRDFDFDE